MSSDFSDLYPFSTGGLYKISSSTRGSTGFSLGCIASSPYEADSSNPHPTFLWISDEGYLYPAALNFQSDIPLSKWLFVKPANSKEAWRIALEATQTGLFEWILMRPSEGCDVAVLRRLQLASEKNRTRLVFLGKAKVPHWLFKYSLNVNVDGQKDGLKNGNVEDHLYCKYKVSTRTGRSLSVAYPQNKYEWRQRAVS